MQEKGVTASVTVDDAHLAGVRETAEPMRRRVPDERKAIVHHFSVGGHEGYLMVGLYEEGQPGEIFIRMAKEGSTIAGLTDSFGIAYRWPCNTVCPWAFCVGSSVTHDSSPAAGPVSKRSGTPNPSWTTSVAGSN